MQHPKVSIILSTFNRANLIGETLQSVINQSYSNWECLIVDDGSEDNTKEVVTNFISKDDRLKYFMRPDNYEKGLPGVRNYGLDLAEGDYIVFFDDDDIVHIDLISICISTIKENNVDFINYQKQSFIGFFNEAQISSKVKIDKTIYYDCIIDILNNKIAMASCTVLWKKSCFERERFNESLMYAEEWELYTRIISKGFNGLKISNVLYFNRKHADSNTGEFYRGSKLRLESKKKAIKLIFKNLKSKGLLSYEISNYLLGLVYGFRDFNLFIDSLKIIKPSLKKLVYHYFKYVTFPIYKLKKVINVQKN